MKIQNLKGSKSKRKIRREFFNNAELNDFLPMVGKLCYKLNRTVGSQPKPFKSGSKVNTIKGVIIHPVLWEPAYIFEEDDSFVACKGVVVFENYEIDGETIKII